MQFAYPACFVAMAAEAWWRGAQPNRTFAAGVCRSPPRSSSITGRSRRSAPDGPSGSVPPHSTRVTAGPYRFLDHPNYVAVAAELAGMGLMAQAPVSAAVSIAGFGGLMLARIRVEERALGVRR